MDGPALRSKEEGLGEGALFAPSSRSRSAPCLFLDIAYGDIEAAISNAITIASSRPSFAG